MKLLNEITKSEKVIFLPSFKSDRDLKEEEMGNWATLGIGIPSTRLESPSLKISILSYSDQRYRTCAINNRGYNSKILFNPQIIK